MGKTQYFGLNKFGQEGSISDEGYKFSLKDRESIDALLYTLYQHSHSVQAIANIVTPPNHAPTLTLDTSGGILPAATDLYYRVSFLDIYGNETEGSVAAYVRTPNPYLEPPIVELATAATGGTLISGIYRYALSFYKGTTETKAPNISTITVPAGTSTNTVTITLPTHPTGSTGWKVYRKGPGDIEYWLLDTIVAGGSPPTTYVDDGTPAPDCTKKRPVSNTTNASNSVVVEIAASDLPLSDGVTSWRIYRTSIPGSYGTASLVATVTDTTTEGGADLVTSYPDVGNSLLLGRPLDMTSVPPTLPQLDASDSFDTNGGPLPSALGPRGVQEFHTFLPGTLAVKDYNQFTPTYDMHIERLEGFFITAPTGVSGANYVTIRVSDVATQNEIQSVYTDGHTVDEVQMIVSTLTSGSFTLTFSGQTTSAIQWNDGAAVVEAALEALSNITDVDVLGSGSASDPFYVIFRNPGAQNVAQMTDNSASVTVTTSIEGFDGGTFTLTFDGQTTAATAFNASAATLASNLEALSNITDVTVTGAGVFLDPWIVEFVNPGAANLPTMTGNPANLGGSSVFVSSVTDGYGSTVINLNVVTTAQYQVWQSSLTDFGSQEAESAPATGGTPVSDILATNETAVYLDAQNETNEWNVGVLDPGNYTARFWASDNILTALFDLEVRDLTGPTVMESASIAIHRATYSPFFSLDFVSTGVEDIELRVKKTDTGTDQVRVDKYEYEAVLPVLHAGSLCTVEVLVTGTPTTNGADVQANLWY